MERITSPEQMNDYIRVSNPSVWMLLAAVIVLLIGVCVWGAFGHLDTAVQTGGVCEDGRLTVYLSESDFAKLDGEAILSVGEAEYAVVSGHAHPARRKHRPLSAPSHWALRGRLGARPVGGGPRSQGRRLYHIRYYRARQAP